MGSGMWDISLSPTCTCRGFESHPRQLIFSRKSDCLGCAVLLCLVCLFDLACFFLSSFSSLIQKHVHVYTCTCNCQCVTCSPLAPLSVTEVDLLDVLRMHGAQKQLRQVLTSLKKDKLIKRFGDQWSYPFVLYVYMYPGGTVRAIAHVHAVLRANYATFSRTKSPSNAKTR